MAMNLHKNAIFSKTEWIPFWSRRATEIYEDEVKQKTQELMMKFDLLDSREPKRSDFPAKAPNPPPTKHHQPSPWDQGAGPQGVGGGPSPTGPTPFHDFVHDNKR